MSITTIPGAMNVAEEARLDKLGDFGQAARRLRAAHPFMLSIARRDNDGNGELASPDEVEPHHPVWFSAPRFAKAAGAALLARHPDALGFDVVKVDGGHWRTVHSEWRSNV